MLPVEDSARPARRHDAAERDGGADADAVGEPAHADAAQSGADPDQRAGQRHDRAVGPQRFLDRLQSYHHRQRRAVADGEQGERQGGGDPGASALNAVPMAVALAQRSCGVRHRRRFPPERSPAARFCRAGRATYKRAGCMDRDGCPGKRRQLHERTDRAAEGPARLRPDPGAGRADLRADAGRSRRRRDQDRAARAPATTRAASRRRTCRAPRRARISSA